MEITTKNELHVINYCLGKDISESIRKDIMVDDNEWVEFKTYRGPDGCFSIISGMKKDTPGKRFSELVKKYDLNFDVF